MKQRRFQFGLLGLVYFVIFLSAFAACILRSWPITDGWTLQRVLTGHSGSVESATYSDDGRLIVSAGNEVIVWDAQTGSPLLQISQKARRVLFSPDASRVALTIETQGSSVPTKTIFPATTILAVYSVKTGEELLRLPAINAKICLPAFSADGTRIATAAEDGKVCVWNSADGSKASEFDTPATAFTGIYPEGPRSVVFSMDGKRLGIAYLPASAPGDWMPQWDVAGWDLSTGRLLEKTPAMKASLNPDTLDPDQWYAGARMKHLPFTAFNDYDDVEFHGFWCIQTCEFPARKQAFTTHSDGLVRLWQRPYPSGPWGHLWRVEVWMAIVFGVLWIRRAKASFRGKNAPTAS